MHVAHGLKQRQQSEPFIARATLVDGALRALENGLAVVSAPGGYGKTWLALQVAHAWQRRTQPRAVRVWTIRSSMSLTQALRSFCELYGQSAIPGSLSPDIAADTAIEVMASCAGDGAALIVDIDGAPPSKAVQALVSQILLEHAPQGHALLVCRNPWVLPIERIAMQRPTVVFRAGELAFSADEIAAAHALDREQAQRWMALSEGWPVLCTHASLRSGTAGIERFVAALADYMEHELLAPLPTRDVKLLMQAAILDTIEPGVLEALELGAPWSRLAALVESGVPVSTQQTNWDRIVLHPVFRAFLERRLRVRSPAFHHALNRRAASCFAATGNFRIAMKHAIRTDDPVFTAQLTEHNGGWRISWREGLRALDGGVAGAELSDEFPKAALARIYWQAQTGRVEEARAALARLQALQPAQGMHADFIAIDAVIAIYRDAAFDENAVALLSDLPSGIDEPLLRLSAATLQAAMFNSAGLYDRGASTARASIVEAQRLDSSYVEFYGHLQYALALHGLGRVLEALPEYARARELAEDIFGEAAGECRLVSLSAAHAGWLAGNDEGAEQAAGDLSGLYRLHAWFEPYARTLEVACSLSRSRGDRGLEEHVLEDFSDLAERRELHRLKIMVQVCKARQALAEGQAGLAERCCTTALQLAAERLSLGTATAARVIAPVYLMLARIALTAGRFDDAAQALAQIRSLGETLRDGAVLLETGLLEAYVALRARRYRDAAQLLSQGVTQAERSGLRRPFLDNAALVLELVDYARAHALNLDARVLQRAAGLASLAATGERARRAPAASGRLLLTERETDILHFLAEGLSSKEMARRLAIAEGTIKTHRKHLYEKLNAGMRSQAIVKARELGLL